MTSGLVGAASAVASSSGSGTTSGDRLLHPVMWTSSTVALGMAVTAMGLGYDKIPRLCPLSRATIWFQYHPEQGQWVWSPYRSGDVNEGERWISVHTHQVPRRPGATNHHHWATSSSRSLRSMVSSSSSSDHGQELDPQWISAKIIRHLALHNPYPLADFALECPLCLQTWHNPATIRRGRTCGHGICTQCYSGYVTMIEKRNQHKGKTTATTTKTVGSRSVPCPLCETPF